MNRVLTWLLLVFGLIIAATLVFYLFHLRAVPALTASPAAMVTPASPLQVTEVDRRRPDMLLLTGRAPNGSQITLQLDNGTEVGDTTASSDGTFQLTSRNLPRVAALRLSLSVPTLAPLQLLVIERAPQLLTLVRGLAGWQPLSHPASGNAILVVAQDSAGFTVAGQAIEGSTLYFYADNRLVKKLTLPTDTSNSGKPVLFTAALSTKDAPQTTLRIDTFDGANAPRAQLLLDKSTLQSDSRAWQKIPAGEATLFVWRELAAQPKIADFKSDYPGQFLPQ